MTSRLAALVLLASLALAASARPAAADDEFGEWYGWQTMGCDAVGVGLAVALPRPNLKVAGALTFALGCPFVVHAVVHDSLPRAGLSLAARTVLPLVGYLTSTFAARGHDNAAARIPIMLAGIAAALVTDWALISWETTADPAQARTLPLYGIAF